VTGVRHRHGQTLRRFRRKGRRSGPLVSGSGTVRGKRQVDRTRRSRTGLRRRYLVCFASILWRWSCSRSPQKDLVRKLRN